MRQNCFSLTFFPFSKATKPEVTVAVAGWHTHYKLEMSNIGEEAIRVYEENPSVRFDNDRLWHEAVWREVELRCEKDIAKLKECDVFCWVEMKLGSTFFSGDLT